MTAHAGPRIVGAGHYLSVTGGGGDLNDFSSDNGCCVHPDGIICDGADAMRLAVRREIKYGSDWIKVRVAACRASTLPPPKSRNTGPVYAAES